MDIVPGKLLSQVNSPEDIRKLRIEELDQLAQETREYIIDVISGVGGHLGASLGVVELTIALHYVFNTPYDKLVWDVGHQAYGHKILTGRREEFKTIRQHDSISGFPRSDESEYDAFGVGHASTSVSAALGMAVASKLSGDNERNHIAVIGDGSLTGGLIFEGLNNAGVSKANILVVLNDNSISIDASVGAMKEYLVDITTSFTFNKFREDTWHLFGKMKKLGVIARSVASRTEHSVKAFLFKQSNLFESLNFRYFGPVDGHDTKHLIKILGDMKKIQGPKLLHVMTVKGKGYRPAEEHQTRFHSPGLFDKKTGDIYINGNEAEPPRFQDVFGLTLVELADQNDKILGISPAMPSGCSLNYMMDKYPERSFDVGIAEEHAITFAAGLAKSGYKPYCAIYSSFLQRAYDQIVHDVCIQKLPVVFCIDRAGLVGEDGVTHHGFFDIAFLRSIPEIVIAAPLNEWELRNMMYTAMQYKGPFAIRYPRGRGNIKDWKNKMKEIEVGKGQMLVDGEKIAVLSIGTIGNTVIQVCQDLIKEGLRIGHYDMKFVKPLDKDLLDKILKKYPKIITIEDGIIKGGFGSAVLEYISENGFKNEVKCLGIPDRFISHGKISELQQECGFHHDDILKLIKIMYK